MSDIPVSFSYKGVEFDGLLSAARGAASLEWELRVNGNPRGELRFGSKEGWTFSNNKGRFDEWALVFGRAVEKACPERSFKAELPPP